MAEKFDIQSAFHDPLLVICQICLISYLVIFLVRHNADTWNKLKNLCSKEIGEKMKVRNMVNLSITAPSVDINWLWWLVSWENLGTVSFRKTRKPSRKKIRLSQRLILLLNWRNLTSVNLITTFLKIATLYTTSQLKQTQKCTSIYKLSRITIGQTSRGGWTTLAALEMMLRIFPLRSLRLRLVLLLNNYFSVLVNPLFNFLHESYLWFCDFNLHSVASRWKKTGFDKPLIYRKRKRQARMKLSPKDLKRNCWTWILTSWRLSLLLKSRESGF